MEFRGFIPDEKIVETYNSFDIFVFPSKHEGFGIPIIEAHRCGLPVVILQDAKIPEEVKECTVRCSDQKDMIEKIYYLLADQKMLKKTVASLENYSKKFNWNNCCKETIKVYEKISRFS